MRCEWEQVEWVRRWLKDRKEGNGDPSGPTMPSGLLDSSPAVINRGKRAQLKAAEIGGVGSHR